MTIDWTHVDPNTWRATSDYGDGPRIVATVRYEAEGRGMSPAGWAWDTAQSVVGGDQHSDRTWPTAGQAMDDCDRELAG